ncbi:MAG: hypothetical protein EOM26_11280 [Alphaproteobacteria bacterium]|nr:hypothetical protein [Alphaproteobacteria bacterium]
MASAKDAKLQYEAGQTAYAMAALTDTGDATTFTGVAAPWSRRSGYAPTVYPDGLISGATITPNGNNSISVSIGSAYIGGALVTVTAKADLAVPALAAEGSDTHIIYSIQVGTDGVVTAEAGEPHTSFGARNGDGGAPYVLADHIELGQVRLSAKGAVAITAAMISQIPGTTQERFDTPLMLEVDHYRGRVTFASAFEGIHALGAKKKVWAAYSTPSFAEVLKSSDFVPPEVSYSVSSEQYYGGNEGSVSSSLGQGSFTARLADGISDPMVALKGETLWFRFYPDRARSGHLMCQGTLGIARTFPAGGSIQASCTISAESEGAEALA